MKVQTYSLRIFLRGDSDRVFTGLSRVAVKRYVAYFQEYSHYHGLEVGEE